MKTADVLTLMGAMAQHKIGVLEMPGLKLVLSPDRPAGTAAATNLMVPSAQMPTAEQAQKALQAARFRARELAEAQLAQAQVRTTRARNKAAGGIGSPVSKLVADVYEASSKSAPKTASG